MSNFAITNRRRIERFFETIGSKPKIAPLNTNHIDNPDIWGNETLYKGELFLNINDGIIYSVSDTEIINFKESDGIFNGLQVYQPVGSWSGGIPRWLAVTDGEFYKNGKKYIFKTSMPLADGDLQVSENNTDNGRFDIIVIKPSNNKYNSTDEYYKGEIIVKDGVEKLRDLISNKFPISGEPLISEDEILIGVVWIPPHYDDSSVHQLRPFSVSRERFLPNSDLEYQYYLNDLNITGSITNFNLNLQASDLVYILLTSYFNDNFSESLNGKLKRVYIEGQFVIGDNAVYKIIKTHFCGNSLDVSVSDGNAKVMSGSGGSGTSNHSLLTNLDFVTSGHTGFQRQPFMFDRDPTNLDNADLGNFWYNNVSGKLFFCVDDTFNHAEWVNINTNVRETKANKNQTARVTVVDGDLATDVRIFYTPANDSYVSIFVNGVQYNLGDGVKTADCYFSSDSGTTARQINEIQSNDSFHWNGTVAGFELDVSDKISFNYLIDIDNTFISGTLTGPIWGGLSNSDWGAAICENGCTPPDIKEYLKITDIDKTQSDYWYFGGTDNESVYRINRYNLNNLNRTQASGVWGDRYILTYS